MSDHQGRKRRKKIQPEPPKIYNILLPLTNLKEAEIFIPLAEAIARQRHGQLLVLCAVSVPEGNLLSDAAGEASKLRVAINDLTSEIAKVPVQARTIVRSSNEVWDGIWEIVRKEHIDLLILAWRNANFRKTTVINMDDVRLRTPPCDVAAVSISRDILDSNGWKSINRVLMPVRGGANAALTLRVGDSLARWTGANSTLLHVTSSTTREDEEIFIEQFRPVLYSLEHITRSVTLKGEIPPGIVSEAQNHDLVIMGAPTRQIENDPWSGPLLEAVIANTNAALIVVRERQPSAYIPEDVDEPGAIHVDHPISVVVDKWFAENTYLSREFSELDQLTALKNELGVTISLGLPALNEAETVGKVIQTAKTALMEEIPLLDEIVLIDSGSVDYTREIASDLGVPVYIHQEVLPNYGSFHGKGEALWKSLFVLKGDVIAWIDTDIKNIHPRFIYGIIGPLLRNPRVQYVRDSTGVI